jgi:Xaa-Pro aminopeptidase
MKYHPIPPALFIKNRKNFMGKMKPSSLAVFNSNDVFTTGADSNLPFTQNRDLFYLSGADQEHSILVLFPECPDPAHREVLFVTETNAHIAVWEGEKLTKEKATEVTGIKTVYWLADFDKKFFEMMTQCDTIYFNTNEHYRQSVELETREDRFIKKTKAQFPAHTYAKAAPILQRLRAVKDPIEIELIQQACNITNAAYRRVLGFLKPGVM